MTGTLGSGACESKAGEANNDVRHASAAGMLFMLNTLKKKTLFDSGTLVPNLYRYGKLTTRPRAAAEWPSISRS